MAETGNIIYAPKIDPNILWKMSAEEFNDWRKKNDYPRIMAFLKKKLPKFEDWMEEQKLTDEDLIKHSPSTFLGNHHFVYLYSVLDHEKREKEILSEAKYSIGETFFHQNLVQHKKEIILYTIWYTQKTKQRAPEITVNLKQGRNHFIFSELQLLDLGNCHLINMFDMGQRNLDFVNISDLTLINCLNNTTIKLWFCSAENLSVDGDLAFVHAYNTSFYEIHNQKIRNFKLLNGAFQNWTFKNCRVNLSASNSILQLWNFNGWDFAATITNSDIRDCVFENSIIRYPIDYGRARDFHSHIKRLYSQIGKKNEASYHYYMERTFQRKSFLYPRENFHNNYFKAKTKIGKLKLKAWYILRYIYSGFINLLWGYGERPARVFAISIATILIFSLVFCFSPEAAVETKHNFTTALYYSSVTFTTLGYGDIHQTNNVLRLLSAFEALLGMTFWGILIAGFTSNSKDY